MRWNGWGDPERAAPLPEPVLAILRDGLGVRTRGTTSVQVETLAAPPTRLSDAAVDALRGVVGDDHLLMDDASRVAHTRGKSTTDLLRMRAGDLADAPDAVVVPGSHDEVVELLTVAGEHGIAVVPFGGGTSVVGGLAPDADGRAVVAVDLRRLDRVTEVDVESRLATLEAGLRGPTAERLLAEHGLSVGHFPQSFEFASVGGFAATRSSGQASSGYGRFDQAVVGLRVATPAGTWELGGIEATAAGPDLRQVVLGSEGAFGIVTAVTVKVHPTPTERRYEGWRFDTFAAGCLALRRLAQDGPRPTVLRLSDEAETAVGLARGGEVGTAGSGSGGCLLIVGYEGADAVVRREAGAAVLTDSGGQNLGPGPGEDWLAGRFHGPYLRDSLLDAGALCETLETAATWTALPTAYQRVREALTTSLGEQGSPPLVLCHVSHTYASSASLYFTVVSAQTDEPVVQWQRAKAAATDAMVETGATITHHHAVGRDHQPWLAQEIGELGVRVLQAIKAEVDQDNICNPGVLIPGVLTPSAPAP